MNTYAALKAKLKERDPNYIKSRLYHAAARSIDDMLAAPLPRFDRMLSAQVQNGHVHHCEVEVLKEYPKISDVPPLLDFQKEPLWNCVEAMGKGESRLLIAPTGSGKTYFFGMLLRLLRHMYPEKFAAHKHFLYITKPTIVTQSSRVILGEYKNKRVIVTSYPQMTSSFGDLFIRYVTRIVNGQPVLWPIWDEAMLPCGTALDEVQGLKNADTLQTDMAISLFTETNVPCLPMSATPYSRPIHTRSVVLALRMRTRIGLDKNHLIGVKEFPSWIKEISAPKSEYDWCPAAMKRIQEFLEPKTLRFGKLSYKHRTFIKQMLIDMPSHKARIYQDAFDEYQKKRESYGLDPLVGFAEILVSMMKFRQTSEMLRADDLARLAFDVEQKENKSVIIACSFQDTLKLVHQHLRAKGVIEDEIATIMGGQSLAERQLNIDQFQSGRRRFMLLMFSAGGAGLSLHHHRVGQRPRVVFLPPVWNAEELVQVLGRAHRINSMSTTYQFIVWFRGTIEERVMEKVKRKCSALKEVVGKREAWTEFFDTTKTSEAVAKKQPKDNETTSLKDKDDDDDNEVDEDLPVDTEE